MLGPLDEKKKVLIVFLLLHQQRQSKGQKAMFAKSFVVFSKIPERGDGGNRRQADLHELFNLKLLFRTVLLFPVIISEN